MKGSMPNLGSAAVEAHSVPKRKSDQPDLADGGQAGHDQVDTDEEDKDDRDQTADKKQEVHKDFQRSELLFHDK